ncbi:Hypothetical predicted protein [Mytilus galloprovincialis]|uniref:PHD-type domain-containing protein n=1 Tax=Mytilus galloprovincialis TaxID=29158 RepID=A0A8B6HKB4_MYTGA|nr:Hypothetical predicted protein [Mytilus galloprovincialis]
MEETLSEDVDPSVEFLYKTMLERDPKKRKVKPVEKHLIQVDFGLDDSDDDSDFEVGDHKADSEESDGEGGENDKDSEADKDDYSSSQSSDSDKDEESKIDEEENEDAGDNSIDSDYIPNANSTRPKNLKLTICCVCLGDVSVEDDEIVECDNCGVSVHEGCYGISENQSTCSTVSSASTEPWFCDACKAGCNPTCELCPNLGGIFKETDAGNAQKEGLLSEAAPDECMDIADPFFAYCKMHAEKHMARAKRRNWLAIQSHIKKHATVNKIEDEKEKARFERKLNRHRQKFHLAMGKRPPAWVPTQKLVRYLTSSPSCVRKMLKKAELMGVITQTTHVSDEKQEVRKKSHVPAALSVEFVSYFLERNNKIDSMKASIKDTILQNKKLQEQEKILRRQYDQLFEDAEELRESGRKMRKEGESLWNILNDIGKKNLPLPDVFKVKKSPVKLIMTTRRENTSNMGSKLLHSPNLLIHHCAVCKKSTDTHMMVKCDSCKLYYHLECLDPPLTRMPKKTKLMGWQCSECDKSSSDEQDVPAEELEAPRKLREKIKEPNKWGNDLQFEFAKLTKYKMKKKKTKKIKKEKVEVESTDSQDKIINSPEKMIVDMTKNLKKKRPIEHIRPAKKLKEETIELECVVCCKPGTASDTVRCDECRLSYHFGCLDPPMKKTPKQRGYSWHCEACDPTDDSDEDEAEAEEGNE